MITVNDFLETDLGNVSPNPCGDYDGAAAYEYLDQVHYAGGSYLCVVPIGQTITGVAPTEGKTTAQWQCVAIPGNIRPDYIAMHDQVAKDAEQTAADRVAVAADRDEVATARADVEQMRLDTAACASEAEASRDSAAGYNRTAHAAMEAAEQARQDVQALVTGFDARVEGETLDAVATVETARQTAVSVVNVTGETIIADARAAQSGAEVARTGAETARTGAETARTGAETAKAGADTAKAAAKTSETNAGKSAEAAKVSETNAKASEAAAAQTQREVTDYVESQKAAFVGYSRRETDSQYANAIIKTATGEGRVDVDDAWTAPVIGLDVAGRSEQVVTTGAQLLDVETYVKTGVGSRNYSSTDGKITILSNDTSGITDRLIDFAPDSQITISTENPCNISVFDSQSGTIKALNNITTITVTVPQDGKIAIKFQASTYPYDCGKVMLNAGSAALPYEPYTGAAASPSPAYPQQIVSTGTVGTGAQLLDLRAGKSGTGEGVTYANNGDGAYKRTGTASGIAGNVWFLGGYNIVPTEDNSNVLLTLKAGKRYTIRNCNLFTVESGQPSTMAGTVTIDTATYPEGFKVTGVRNPAQVVGTTYNDTIYPMVCEGDTAKPWEPYTGGKPAPSAEYPQEMTVRAVGKNLLEDRLYSAGYAGGTGLVLSFKGITLPYRPERESVGIGKITHCKKGETYTFSITNPNPNCALVLTEYESVEAATDTQKRIDNAFTSASKPITYTAKSDGILLCVVAGVWTDGHTMIHECTESELLQCEVGTTATPYEPYCTAAATITLTEPLRGTGEYRDRLGLRDGVWGIEGRMKSAKVAINIMMEDVAKPRHVGVFHTMDKAFKVTGNIMCSKSKRGDIDEIGSFYENLNNVVFVGSIDDTLETLKEKYDGAELIYPLATPTWTPLPDSAQQTLNALTTYAGTTHLTITTGGTTPDVTLDYVQDTHKALEEHDAAAKKYTDNQLANIVAAMPVEVQAAIVDTQITTLLKEV